MAQPADQEPEPPDDTEFDRKMRVYVLFLRDEHRLQIDRLQRAGNRTALWTFLGGAVLGVLGNVVVAVLMG
ncbi:hypothetical protein [Paractinoplanes toevensis]|uniref:Uncharacterized protein n=1 Tax=Paractinoplanes toevensis TaxID=571911 RepID=A0A919TD64_9ACTN|nr:hypothetical protein [Actinoplanes toevensis]GIM92245.1 hypothetical protein Ato02nite_040380 [Actinoplanes toevensis]